MYTVTVDYTVLLGSIRNMNSQNTLAYPCQIMSSMPCMNFSIQNPNVPNMHRTNGNNQIIAKHIQYSKEESELPLLQKQRQKRIN